MRELCAYENKLISSLKQNGIEINKSMLDKLKQYYDLLVEWNEKFNLTAITEVNEVYVKHFLDSAFGVLQMKENASVCDIGTGAGFPGIVLKILRPDIKLYLVDSLQKRVGFLNEVIDKLNLTECYALHFRAEDVEFKNKYLNSFDYVVARAVAKLNTLSEYCLPYVKNGGKFLAYKSSTEIEVEISEAKNAIDILGGSNLHNNLYKLDSETNRLIISIDKIKNTNNKYPRGQNKPRLSPL